jgi:molybdate transport system substrate-binding protein
MGDKVRVAFAPAATMPVTYPVAVVADSRQKALAGDFVAFLSSDAAREVLARHGFGTP